MLDDFVVLNKIWDEVVNSWGDVKYDFFIIFFNI